MCGPVFGPPCSHRTLLFCLHGLLYCVVFWREYSVKVRLFEQHPVWYAELHSTGSSVENRPQLRSRFLVSWMHCVSICDNNYYTTHYYTRLTALFLGLPRWAGTRKVNLSGFYWSKRQWVAVASAGRMQVCTSLQTDNHASTPPLSFLQTGCPSCCPANSVKALKACTWQWYLKLTPPPSTATLT